MSSINLIPVFMIGLLGGVHCIGMCGGIVGAFSAASTTSATSTTRRSFPIAVVADSAAALHLGTRDNTLRVLAYNVGRISSYAIAGALAGGLTGGVRALTGLSTLQMGGYWLANLMLIALGLYLMDVWRGLVWLETAGQNLWQHLQPLTKYLLPLDSPFKALALGGLWGWLPCGMVYSMLLTAMFSGSARSGAIVMLVFGLGTLPTLLTLGLLGTTFKHWAQRRSVRIIGGMIVLTFGVLGLARIIHGMPLTWLDTLCINPAGIAR